jgi:predicted deacylase
MEEIDECVWRLDSGQPGTRLLVLGGVHGNELSGIVVVREMLEAFERQPGLLAAGTLTLAFGNPAAIARGTRGSGPHRDLNRAFIPERLADRGLYEHRRAAILAARIDEADVLLDLHATNKLSEPFLATTALTDRHLRLSQAFACDRLVVVSPSAIEGTTDSRINSRGGTGFVYESGLAGDVTNVEAVRMAVNFVMALEGMMRYASPPPRPAKRIFELTEALRLTEAGFRFADGRGLRSFEPMRAGDLIGYAGDAPVTAPYDGVLLFPKIPNLWKLGAPLVFFARATRTP